LGKIAVKQRTKKRSGSRKKLGQYGVEGEMFFSTGYAQQGVDGYL